MKPEHSRMEYVRLTMEEYQTLIDSEPIKHGKWQEITTHNGCTPDYDCVCSECGGSGLPYHNYCHTCGAKNR